jgi:hypothetical protein
MKPIEPKDVAHYIAACRVAGVPVAVTSEPDLRALIERCSTLSIPDAVRLPRRGLSENARLDGQVSTLVNKSTIQLDGNFLVMDVYQYTDGECRIEVVYQVSRTRRTTVMLQRRSSLELAIAAIARDLTTFATRVLATLPTIGLLDDLDDDAAEES